MLPIEQEGVYDPLDANAVPFSPTEEYASTLLDSLRKSGLISISEHSAADSIFHEGSQVIFIREKVCWTGDIDRNLKVAEDIEDRARTGDWPEHWYPEVEESWLNLALAERKSFMIIAWTRETSRARRSSHKKHVEEHPSRLFGGTMLQHHLAGGEKRSDFLVRRKTKHTQAGNFMLAPVSERPILPGQRDMR